MEDLTWTVVQFTEDRTVEAIPTSWIQGDFCHWPPYKQAKLKNSIKKCEKLDKQSPRHKIQIFRNATFDDYGRARNKARLAEDFSDLNSGNESNSKRKRIQKVLSSSSEDESNPSLLPPLPKCSTVTQFRDSDMTSYSNSPEHTDSMPMSLIPSCASNMADDSNRNQPSTSNLNCCLQHEHKILIEIKNQNHMLRGILVDLLSEVRNLKGPTNIDSAQSIFVKYPDITFPIENEIGMKKFEEELKNEENFIGAVNEIAKFGGSNPYNFIKRTMSSLIKDEILVKYSWLGRKGKRCLETSPIAKLIIRAADKALPSYSQKQIEDAIKSFLKRGNERLAAKENKRA